MPSQDRAGGDQQLQVPKAGSWRPVQQRGQHGAVGAIHLRPRVLALQYGELVAQHQHLHILVGAAAPEQAYCCEELDQTDVNKPQQNLIIIPEGPSSSDVAAESGGRTAGSSFRHAHPNRGLKTPRRFAPKLACGRAPWALAKSPLRRYRVPPRVPNVAVPLRAATRSTRMSSKPARQARPPARRGRRRQPSSAETD